MGEWLVKPKWETDFELYVSQWMAWLLVAEVIALLLFFLLLYLVIKAAIRDGINESRLADRRWSDAVPDAATRDALRETREAAKGLPPIRAD